MIMPSLDAVSPEILQRLDDPVAELNIEKYFQGLIDFRKEFSGDYWLECFLAEGINDSIEELSKIKEVVTKINPTLLQLNSLDRPPVDNRIKPISFDKMLEIAEFFKPLPVEIIAKYKSQEALNVISKDLEQAILAMINRRPCTLDDIVKSFKLTTMEANKILRVLDQKKLVQVSNQERGNFYKKFEGEN